MSEEASPTIEAITTAMRLARELSEAINKAEELGAILDIEVQQISIAGKPIKQVMVLPVKF